MELYNPREKLTFNKNKTKVSNNNFELESLSKASGSHGYEDKGHLLGFDAI
jgi:hypothetical protein